MAHIHTSCVWCHPWLARGTTNRCFLLHWWIRCLDSRWTACLCCHHSNHPHSTRRSFWWFSMLHHSCWWTCTICRGCSHLRSNSVDSPDVWGFSNFIDMACTLSFWLHVCKAWPRRDAGQYVPMHRCSTSRDLLYTGWKPDMQSR